MTSGFDTRTSAETTAPDRPAPASHGIREVRPDDSVAVEAITRLHLELLHFGPMARLGELVLRRFCYGTLLEDGLMRAAIYEVEGEPAGLLAYTARSITFHRTALRRHLLYMGWLVAISVLRSPRRAPRLLKVVKLMLSRRAEAVAGSDPSAEVLAIGVRPAFRTPEFVRRRGVRVGEALLAHAGAYFQRAGLRRVRMVVDADNRATLLFYHALGGVFEPYEQAGVPSVLVWFTSAQLSGCPDPQLSPSWDVEPALAARGGGSPRDWASYWDTLTLEEDVFRAEADEHVRRLRAAVALGPQTRVLDFGCGFGLVAQALAPHVAELHVWDASARMRGVARLNVAACPNVSLLDLSEPEALRVTVPFDVILVNSVVQYMPDGELTRWLRRWRDMLVPNGCVVLSDLLPPGLPAWKESIEYLLFHSSRRRFAAAARQAGREIRRYAGLRSNVPLAQISREEIARQAAAAGLRVEVLPRNLTFHRGRLSVLLRRPPGTAGAR